MNTRTGCHTTGARAVPNNFTTYTTSAGDSLQSIAIAQYNDINQAGYIAALNDMSDTAPDAALPTGTTLTLDTQPSAAFAVGLPEITVTPKGSINWVLILGLIAAGVALYYVFGKRKSR